LLFAATCGIALSIKSTGITLWPLIGYLIYVQFWSHHGSGRAQIFALIEIIGVI